MWREAWQCVAWHGRHSTAAAWHAWDGTGWQGMAGQLGCGTPWHGTHKPSTILLNIDWEHHGVGAEHLRQKGTASFMHGHHSSAHGGQHAALTAKPIARGACARDLLAWVGWQWVVVGKDIKQPLSSQGTPSVGIAWHAPWLPSATVLGHGCVDAPRSRCILVGGDLQHHGAQHKGHHDFCALPHVKKGGDRQNGVQPAGGSSSWHGALRLTGYLLPCVSACLRLCSRPAGCHPHGCTCKHAPTRHSRTHQCIADAHSRGQLVAGQGAGAGPRDGGVQDACQCMGMEWQRMCHVCSLAPKGQAVSRLSAAWAWGHRRAAAWQARKVARAMPTWTGHGHHWIMTGPPTCSQDGARNLRGHVGRCLQQAEVVGEQQGQRDRWVDLWGAGSAAARQE